MTTFAPYETYVDYLKHECVGRECTINFRIPVGNPATGGVSFPSVSGKLLWAYPDSVVIRGDTGEQSYRFDVVQYIEFPSSISIAKGSARA